MNSKYSPITAPKSIKFEKDFTSSKLRHDEENPDTWIVNLESLQTKMNKVKITRKSEKTEIDLILHILTKNPEEYEVVVSELEDKLDSDPTQVGTKTV